MAKKRFTYFLFTGDQPPYVIGLKWFNHFMKKNMAAVLVKTVVNGRSSYDVWVEYDPVFYGEHKLSKAKLKREITGEILLSCGGFKQRLDLETLQLRQREDYTVKPVCPNCDSLNIALRHSQEGGFKEDLKCISCGYILETRNMR
jgi:hypothetical protein